MKSIDIAIVVVALLLVILVAVALISRPTVPSAAPSTSLLSLQLTDPPQVPNGTQSLNITYSSMQVGYTLNGSSKLASFSGQGSIGLLSLLNLTKTIGNTMIPNGSTVNMVKLNITSATIVINGTLYNVTLPSKQLTMHVAPKKINGTSSIVLDLAPTVVTIYTLNSTVFVMVPSVRAVVVGSNNTEARVGYTHSINATAKAELESEAQNITITSASIAQVGNVTKVSVTVKDNSNSSATIKHVLIFGNESITIANFNPNSTFPMSENVKPAQGSGLSTGSYPEGNPINASFFRGEIGPFLNGTANATEISDVMKSFVNGTFNTSSVSSILSNKSLEAKGELLVSKLFNSSMSNISAANLSEAESKIRSMRGEFDNLIGELERNPNINISARAMLNRSVGAEIDNTDLARIKIEQEHFRVLNFIVSANGTLSLPFSEQESDDVGYAINASQSTTLAFNGSITFANGHLTLALIPGGKYRIVVIGEDGARATANVTAG